MGNIGKGLVAGLVATIVLSLLMVMKTLMGLMPQLDVVKMLSTMLGSPDQPMVGWIAHFVIGIVGYGLAIALLPGTNHVMRGIVIAIGGWLVMMVVLMPMAGAGMFGMSMGIMAPLMTLVLHLVFGAVLGWMYGRQMQGDAPRVTRV